MFARVPSGARLPPPPPRPTSPSRASRAAPPPGLDCERGCEGTRPRVSNGAHSEVLPSTKSKIGFVEKHRSEASCGLGLGAARAALRRASHGVPARGLTPPDGCRSPRAVSLAPSRLTAGEDRGSDQTTLGHISTSLLPIKKSLVGSFGRRRVPACPPPPPPTPHGTICCRGYESHRGNCGGVARRQRPQARLSQTRIRIHLSTPANPLSSTKSGGGPPGAPARRAPPAGNPKASHAQMMATRRPRFARLAQLAPQGRRPRLARRFGVRTRRGFARANPRRRARALRRRLADRSRTGGRPRGAPSL